MRVIHTISLKIYKVKHEIYDQKSGNGEDMSINGYNIGIGPFLFLRRL